MERKERDRKLIRLVFCAIMSAMIIIMTFIPNIGYISIGVVEITSLQIIVALGGMILGIQYGAVLGAVWGIFCLIRATTNPLWALFINPLISVVPRILVGLLAAAVFLLFKKCIKTPDIISAGITGAVASISNTVFVLSAIYFFGDDINLFADAYELVKNIFSTIIGLNGVVELIASIILVPAIYLPLRKPLKKYKLQ